MRKLRLRKGDLKRLAEFFMYAPYGSATAVNSRMVVKSFDIEDLGFTLRKGRFYSYDPVLGIGKRVSKRYVEEIIQDAILYHPEVMLS